MSQAIGTIQRLFRLEGLADPKNAFVVRAGMLIAILAMVLRLVFWLYTQRYWDDALIACLHSENAARGLGLTHAGSAGDPLCGFTSPLGVLIPLLGDLIRVGLGIELLKLVSIPAAGLSVLYLLGLGIHPKVRLASPLLILVMGYAAVEHHQILWGMAGMETQLAVLVLLMSLYYTLTLQPILLGISLGLCMLVRPDFAFWAVISGGYVLSRIPKAFPKVLIVALVLYLPWISFAFYYYGSPIPHTIIAKGIGFGLPWLHGNDLSFFAIKRHTWMTLAEQLHVHLGPAFGGHGAGIHKFFSNGPESPIANLMFFFAVLGSLRVLLRRQWELWPLLLFTVVYSMYYVYFVPIIYGWYKVPYTVVLLMLSVWGVQGLVCLLPKAQWQNRVQTLFAVLYLGSFISVLPLCFYAERMIQQHIENDVRREAGLYLKEHMEPDEVVGTEALGYMAYYSQGKVYDWPGLVSREVVAWSKGQPGERRTLENMCKDLKPDYLYLRDLEVLYHFKSYDWLKKDYHVVAVFEVDPAIKHKIPWIERSVDLIFRIYKRNGPEDSLPYDNSMFPKRS